MIVLDHVTKRYKTNIGLDDASVDCTRNVGRYTETLQTLGSAIAISLELQIQYL